MTHAADCLKVTAHPILMRHMRLTPAQPAPAEYYQSNCQHLLSFVRSTYGTQLPNQLAATADAWLQAGPDAQRLFARLLTRKGPLFRTDLLEYREVSCMNGAIQELLASGLVVENPPVGADQVLGLLRKPELSSLWAGEPGTNRQTAKSQLMDTILSRHPDLAIRKRVAAQFSWIRITRPRDWYTLRLLYFGDRLQDWSAFVLRDLGNVTYVKTDLTTPLFAEPGRLESELNLRRLSGFSYRLEELPSMAPELLNALRAAPVDVWAQRRRDRTLQRIGEWSARYGTEQDAEAAFQMCQSHPARERLVRLYHKQGKTEQVNTVLERIRSNPWHDEETQFAQRWGKRRAGFQPKVERWEVNEVSAQVEAQVGNMILSQHPSAVVAHTENLLIRSLTGLVYWDLVFTAFPGAFTNPFQSGPNDLYLEDFLTTRKHPLQQLEAQLLDDERLQQTMIKNHDLHFGQACSLVHWGMFDSLPLALILEAMPASDIRALTRFMIRNLSRRRTGMPDLFVAYAPQSYAFIEVKSPNDQLQPGQRVWLKAMHDMDIPAHVVHLRLTEKPTPSSTELHNSAGTPSA